MQDNANFKSNLQENAALTNLNLINPYDTTAIAKIINDIAYDKVTEAYHDFDREGRKAKLDEAKKMVKAEFDSYGDDHEAKIMMAETGIDFVAEEFKALEKKIMRKMIKEEGVELMEENTTKFVLSGAK